MRVSLSKGVLTLCISILLFSSFSVYAGNNKQLSHGNSSDKVPKININYADLSALIYSIKGIGKKRAEAIIAYRKNHRFRSLEQLSEVRGFSKNFIKKHNKKLHEVFSIG